MVTKVDCDSTLRARTHTDAQAALERVKREARNEGRREVMQIYRSNACDEGKSEADIEALIEGDQTDDK